MANTNTQGSVKKPNAVPLPQRNPMTHPNAPMAQAQAMKMGPGPGGSTLSGAVPVQGANPTGNPLGNIVPTPTQDVRQTRQNIAFKDMSPIEQGQVAEQQGLDPYMPLQMLQQQAQGATQQGPSQGPVPNTLVGPFAPPGVENFPDDMAHLTQLMAQGYAPGASPKEHSTALNAHAIGRARLAAAMAQAHQATENSQPGGPLPGPNTPAMPGPPPMGPGGPPAPGGPPQLSPFPPGTPQPAPGSSPMPGGMPMPGAPQGPPPSSAPGAPPAPIATPAGMGIGPPGAVPPPPDQGAPPGAPPVAQGPGPLPGGAPGPMPSPTPMTGPQQGAPGPLPAVPAHQVAALLMKSLKPSQKKSKG